MANHFDVSDVAVDELLSDWNGPVGEIIRRETGEIAVTARELCPRRTGRLKASIRTAEKHDEFSGHVKGLVGAGRLAENLFPVVNALDNSQGFTRNRAPGGRQRRGTVTTVRALHPFLTRALEIQAGRGVI